MTVEGTVSEASFVSLSRRLFYRRPVILLLHMAVMGVGLYWTSRPEAEGGTAALGWLPILVLLILFILVTRRAQQQYQGNRTLRSRVRYELRESGLFLQTAEAGGLLPWGEIHRLEQTPSHLVVYGSRGQAFVICKEWFAGPGDAEAFAAAIEAALPEMPRPK
ncbi:MAG: YcxB family protein [Deferrisomatales bacterium]